MSQVSTTSTSPLIKVNTILLSLFTVLMIVTAALAGNGIYNKGSMEWLVTGHQHLGNLLFVLGTVQLVLAFLAFSKKGLSGGIMLSSALVFVLTFAQIGLGYSTRSHMTSIVGWHITVGVALTAAVAILSLQMWQATNQRVTR